MTAKVKPATDIKSVPSSLETAYQKYINPNAKEIVPFVLADPADHVIIENQNNASIVLGRNATNPTQTGRGVVDIAAGRVVNVKQVKDSAGNVSTLPINVETSKETISTNSQGISEKDAARVLLAQSINIDKTFGCPAGSTGKSPDGRSAVAIKADGVRIISRDAACGVKIMVHQDPDGTNSSRGAAIGKAGVELIAGGEMEPMVKAETLALALTEMTSYITKLQTQLLSFYEIQMAFNQQVATELHISPFYAVNVMSDPKNPQQLGKTAIDAHIGVVNASRKLTTAISNFNFFTLGTMTPNDTAAPETLNPPRFASEHHKLD
jgi:hypothetical protein